MTDTDPGQAPGQAPAPLPPRFWWKKRLAVGSLGLVVVLAGVRVYWGHVAERRLRRELDPLVARGEPVSGPGMNIAPVPDAENGALLYLRAAQSIKGVAPSPAQSAFGAWAAYPPYPPQWHKMSDLAVAAHGPTYALVREARGYDRFDWGVKVGTPAFAALLPHLNGQRNLANLIGDAAIYAHVHGDDAAAIELVRDVRHQARAAGEPPAFLITHLVHIGIDALAIYRLNVIAPGLQIEPEDAPPTAPGGPPLLPATRPGAGAALGLAGGAPVPRRPATRAQVRALISELLEDSDGAGPDPGDDGLRRALVSERAGQLDAAAWFGRGSRLLKPMFDVDTLRMMRGSEAMIDATAEPDWPAARAKLAANPVINAAQPARPALRAAMFGGPAGPATRQRPVDYTRLLSTEIGLLPTSRAFEQDMRVRMERRIAAVSLAAQLYRADHAGQWPPSLDALVPKYLPAMPADPLATKGARLQYFLAKGVLPDGGDRPVVYSVGENGVDDLKGDPTKLSALPEYGWINRGADQFRDLSRWRAPLPPEVVAEMEAEAEAVERAAGVADTSPATAPAAPPSAPQTPEKQP